MSIRWNFFRKYIFPHTRIINIKNKIVTGARDSKPKELGVLISRCCQRNSIKNTIRDDMELLW